MWETEKGGQVFIAYKGQEYTENDIYRELNIICPKNYKVKYTTYSDLIFAKIVFNTHIDDRDPYCNYDANIISVNGYNQDEIRNACDEISNYEIDDSDRFHKITNYLYNDKKEKMFKKLSKYMHFCSVIYDINRDEFVAGVTVPNSKYTHLFYGYTKMNKELMFSNDDIVLKYFCDEIYEMNENTYMKDGKIYTLNGEEYIKSPNLVKKHNYAATSDDLNTLLIKITDKEIRNQIEKNIREYLSSSCNNQKVSNFMLNELDKKTKKRILTIIKDTIQEFSLENEVTRKIYELFEEKVEEYMKNVAVPVVHVVKLGNTVVGQTKSGFFHEKFDQILSQVQLDEPIMLIGPAGSGKNVAISQVADALGQHMYYTNNASNEFKLTGFIDAGGNYRDTEFYKAFKNGGIFFLDEIDNSDPSALIVINSALANGYMAFPHETIDRHPNFRIIAAANTWGKGADLQYVGRNALDGATLDRFDNIFFDYDTNLEKALYPNDEVLQFMWAFRNAVYQSKIPHIVSTRGIGKVYKKEMNGIPVQDILTSNVIKNLSQDDINTIIGNMHDINLNNKYYDCIKRLRLGR